MPNNFIQNVGHIVVAAIVIAAVTALGIDHVISGGAALGVIGAIGGVSVGGGVASASGGALGSGLAVGLASTGTPTVTTTSTVVTPATPGNGHSTDSTPAATP